MARHGLGGSELGKAMFSAGEWLSGRGEAAGKERKG